MLWDKKTEGQRKQMGSVSKGPGVISKTEALENSRCY